MSLTRDEIAALMEVVGDAINSRVIVPLDARLRAIEQKLGISSPRPPSNHGDDLAAQIVAELEKPE
jgi:hypothetical protein